MLEIGDKIREYTLIKFLGLGTYGEVWLAEKPIGIGKKSKKFALKFLAGRDGQGVDFANVKNEVETSMEAEGHPNVNPIIDAFVEKGRFVIVNEYASGGSLKDWLEKNKGKAPTIEKAVEITRGILRGLTHLHANNIVHRDLKPDNILLQGETPRISDFGTSRVMNDLSRSNTPGGSPFYMSPESFLMIKKPCVDIWSVGVIFYQLLSGNYPFYSDNEWKLKEVIDNEKPRELSEEIPVEIRQVVSRALQKDETLRFNTANEMLDETQKAYMAWRTRITILSGTIDDPNFVVEPKLEPGIQTEKPLVQPDPIIVTPKAEENEKQDNLDFVPSTNRLIEPKFEIKEPELQKEFEPVPEFYPPNPPKKNLKWAYLVIPAAILLSIISVVSIYQLWSSNRTLIPFRKGDKFGFSDINKNIIIEPKYDEAEPFIDGLAKVKLNGKYGYINKQGNEVITAKYDSAQSFKDNLAKVGLNKKNGIINFSGNEVVPLKFDELTVVEKDIIIAKLDKKIGVIDVKGKEIIPIKFDDLGILNSPNSPILSNKKLFDGKLLFSTVLNGKGGIIDNQGRELIPTKYDKVDILFNGLIAVSLNGKTGCIDETGNEIIPTIYEELGGKGKGLLLLLEQGNSDDAPLLPAKLNGKWGFIDKTGKEIIPFKYESVDNFVEGMALVQANKKIGYIDKTGKEVIPLKYDLGYPFQEGLAAVSLNEKMGFIDQTGKEVISLQYEKVGISFREGITGVKQGGKWGFIDKNNNLIIPIRFDGSEKSDSGPVFDKEGFASVAINKKHGLIDKKGKEIIIFKYDNSVSFAGDLAFVTLNQKQFYIDKKGTEFYEADFTGKYTSSNSNIAANAGNAAYNIPSNTAGNISNSVNSASNIMNSNDLSQLSNITSNRPSNSYNAANNQYSSSNVANTSNSASNTSNKSPYHVGKTATLRTNMRLRSSPNETDTNDNIVGVHYQGAKVKILDGRTFENEDGPVIWVKVLVIKDGCDSTGEKGCGYEGAKEGWMNAKTKYISLDEK